MEQQKYTREEFERSESVEKAVLRKIRAAYELLQDVQELVDRHEALLTKCNSFIPDTFAWQENRYREDFMDDTPLMQGLRALNSIGGELYAKREAGWPFGDTDPTDEQYEQFMELEDKYRELWVDEGHPPHVCAECQAKREEEEVAVKAKEVA